MPATGWPPAAANAEVTLGGARTIVNRQSTANGDAHARAHAQLARWAAQYINTYYWR